MDEQQRVEIEIKNFSNGKILIELYISAWYNQKNTYQEYAVINLKQTGFRFEYVGSSGRLTSIQSNIKYERIFSLAYARTWIESGTKGNLNVAIFQVSPQVQRL